MAYSPGDIPAEDLEIEPARAGIPIDLSLFDTATVTLRDPEGALVAVAGGFTATIGTDSVTVAWPAATVFDEPGVYELELVLDGPGTVRERVSSTRIVVEAIADGWHTLQSARDDWDGAPDQDLILHDLLTEAKREVVCYAPAEDLPDSGRPPYHWRKAQLMHARTLFTADVSDTNGTMGLGGFIVTPKTLEKNTRSVLRPKRGVPVVS